MDERLCLLIDALDGHEFHILASGLGSRGRVSASSAIGIQVFYPGGTKCSLIPVPEKIANLIFGGEHHDEMHIVASSSLYLIRFNAQGIQTR
ncbi:hypothetical protein PQQ51_33255 [Paraburkholderia xenovorans]|uniref:hypothetical protein n=1 Tax=Paraburkholderia xenovorans TaxID=36873 RepID=UPI0038BAE300